MSNQSMRVFSDLHALIATYIAAFVDKGGPSLADSAFAHSCTAELIRGGDLLFLRDIIPRLAHTMATLAFQPGGVTFAGQHYEVIL